MRHDRNTPAHGSGATTPDSNSWAGITIREEFSVRLAAAIIARYPAMQGGTSLLNPQAVADQAVAYADALLARLGL